jgi:hypothetical protein
MNRYFRRRGEYACVRDRFALLGRSAGRADFTRAIASECPWWREFSCSTRSLSGVGPVLAARSSPCRGRRIGDGVIDIEQGAEPALGARPGVEDSDLVGVRIDADVRAVDLADHQHADRLVAIVPVAVRAALAAREGRQLAASTPAANSSRCSRASPSRCAVSAPDRSSRRRRTRRSRAGRCRAQRGRDPGLLQAGCSSAAPLFFG